MDRITDEIASGKRTDEDVSTEWAAKVRGAA